METNYSDLKLEDICLWISEIMDDTEEIEAIISCLKHSLITFDFRNDTYIRNSLDIAHKFLVDYNNSLD